MNIKNPLLPGRFALGFLLSAAPLACANAALLYSCDFNTAASRPALSSYAYPGSAGIAVTEGYSANGTIDSYKGSRTQSAYLTADFSIVPSTATSWGAAVSTGRISIPTPPTKWLAKFTLGFDLWVNRPRPVLARIESFNSGGTMTGRLDKVVFPPAANCFYRFNIDLSDMSATAGTFNPADAYVNITFELNSWSGQAWPKSSGNLLRVDNLTYSTPKYFVDGVNGSDSSARDGLSESTAFRTLQRAADLAQPGDTISVMNGVYKNSNSGSVATLKRAGTPAKWITLRSYPGHSPGIEFNSWSGISIGNGIAYVEIRGLEIKGNRANVTLQDALADGDPYKTNPSPLYNGSGVSVDGRTLDANGSRVPDESVYVNRSDRPHHIRIVDNYIHDACGGGVACMMTDHVVFEGNDIVSNAWYTRYGASGLSVLCAWDFDTFTGYKTFYLSNTAADNRTKVPWVYEYGKSRVSDGNGMIVDTSNNGASGNTGVPYGGRFLLQNNLVFNSGAGGLHAFASDHVDIINNTAYWNNTTSQLDYGEIDTTACSDCRVINNIAWASSGKDITHDSNPSYGSTTTNAYNYNVYWGDSSAVVAKSGANDKRTNPLLKGPSITIGSGDFHLQPGSPARDTGLDDVYAPREDLDEMTRPYGSAIDRGAYEYRP